MKETKEEKVYNIGYTKEEIETEINELLSTQELQVYFRTQKLLEKYEGLMKIYKEIK